MKPLNYDNSPCSPISSNCVIWQGPDLPCIKLCKGDTISDVVEALALELCGILDILDIKNYDLTCFDITACGPKDFVTLIQFLIDRICALENIDTTLARSGAVSTRSSSADLTGCPDCVVSVAPCFVIGTQTTMQLVDYVNAIGLRICSIITDISNINLQISNLLIRVTALEDTPPPAIPIPSIVINCNIGTLLSGNSYSLDIVLDQLINNTTNGYCSLMGVLGTISQIGTSLVPDCSFSTDITSNPNWTATPTTLAESITNIWIALCQITSTPLSVQDTNSVNLDFTTGVLTANVQDTGWVNLSGFAFMSANSGRPQCRRIGNVIHFRGYAVVPMGNASSGAGGVINTSNDADDYVPLAYGNTFNTIDSINAADSCLLIGYNGGVWASGTAIGLRFNKGNSVIPTSVIPVGNTLDGSYVLGTRQIIQRSVRTTGNINAGLNSLVGVSISSTGVLQISGPLYDESYASAGSGIEYSAIGRNVISNIISGENVPTFTPTAPSSYNTAAAGAYSPSLIGDTDTWAFTQNAGHADQLGGFIIQLSGLMSYIGPCETLIPTPVPCT
jgi:hypothetical protein